MDPRNVHTARSNAEAEIIKGWLEQQGIQARIFNGEMAGGAFDIIESDPQVIVNSDDYERALKIIDDFRAELELSPDMSNVSDAEGQFNWPMCPVCDEMRLALCDQCNMIGSEFSTDESAGGIQVICLECNAQTTITFVDKCKFCEHDFTGETPDIVSLKDSSMESTNTNRVILLLFGLLVLLVVLTIWFVIATR